MIDLGCIYCKSAVTLNIVLGICSVGDGGHATVSGVFRKLGSHKEGCPAAPLFQLPSLQRQQTACVCQGKVITPCSNAQDYIIIDYKIDFFTHSEFRFCLFFSYGVSVPVDLHQNDVTYNVQKL